MRPRKPQPAGQRSEEAGPPQSRGLSPLGAPPGPGCAPRAQERSPGTGRPTPLGSHLPAAHAHPSLVLWPLPHTTAGQMLFLLPGAHFLLLAWPAHLATQLLDDISPPQEVLQTPQTRLAPEVPCMPRQHFYSRVGSCLMSLSLRRHSPESAAGLSPGSANGSSSCQYLSLGGAASLLILWAEL